MTETKVIWMSNQLYQSIVRDANEWLPKETGGIFMGYQANNGDLVVTNIIDAGEKASHKKWGFSPDQEYQLEKIAQIYNGSNGTITYLGDWHSHPHSKPELSWLDKRTLTRIALTPESNNPHPVMAILGSFPSKWTLNVVQFLSGRLGPWPFPKCHYNIIHYKQFNP